MFCSLSCGYMSQAQDDCLRAAELGDITSFCSQGFSNVGATASGVEPPTCWGQDDDQSDVWLTFVPRQPGLLLSFFGRRNNGCLLYTSPSPRDQRGSRMPSSA